MDTKTRHRNIRKNVKKHRKKKPTTYDKHHMTPSDKRFVKMKQLNQKHKHKASKKTLEKRINETQCCDCKKTQQKKLFSVNQWSKKRPTCRECICTIVVEEKRIAKEKSLLKKCHKYILPRVGAILPTTTTLS